MDDLTIILPSNFKYPRYFGGRWLDCRLRWNDEDLNMLAAACDMKISPMIAANTLGRAPSNLAYKAIEMGFFVPKVWRDLVSVQRPKLGPKVKLEYPYIVKPDDKYNDLIVVNRLVSKHLPGREDVCQDIMLALWESRTSLDDLKNDPRAVRQFVKSFRKTCFEKGGYAESMDVTLYSQDGDGGSKYEDLRYQRTLENEDDKFIEEAIFGKNYEKDFTESVINDIDAEEQLHGVPAAFWMRSELLKS